MCQVCVVCRRHHWLCYALLAMLMIMLIMGLVRMQLATETDDQE